MANILVVGDGAWGTAMAINLVEAWHCVTLWGVDGDYLEAMRRERANPRFLPGIDLPESLMFTSDLAEGLSKADVAFIAVPTQFMATTLASAIPVCCPPVISMAKGIERGTLRLPTAIIADLWKPERMAVLSGPVIAAEIARRLPASAVIASNDTAFSRQAQDWCSTPRFRVYTVDDPMGVELAGALKNVLAIAAGIARGLELGDNALAALVTRGMAENARLGQAMGANPATFWGLAGVGDAITTCYSRFGRNQGVGVELGLGRRLSDILAGRRSVAEGVETTESALQLAAKHGVELPIAHQVQRVLLGLCPAREAVALLMGRPPRRE